MFPYSHFLKELFVDFENNDLYRLSNRKLAALLLKPHRV